MAVFFALLIILIALAAIYFLPTLSFASSMVILLAGIVAAFMVFKYLNNIRKGSK